MDSEIRRRRFKRIKSTLDDHEEEKPRVPKLPDYNRSKTKVCHSVRTSLLATGSDWKNFSGFGTGSLEPIFVVIKVNL